MKPDISAMRKHSAPTLCLNILILQTERQHDSIALAKRSIAYLAHILRNDGQRTRLSADSSAAGADAVEWINLDIVTGHPSRANKIVSMHEPVQS